MSEVTHEDLIKRITDWCVGLEMVEAEGDMSNFDHEISPGLEEDLRNNPSKYAAYPCWNCYCNVLYREGQFQCIVQRHRETREIISANTLREIMEQVSEKYGDD